MVFEISCVIDTKRVSLTPKLPFPGLLRKIRFRLIIRRRRGILRRLATRLNRLSAILLLRGATLKSERRAAATKSATRLRVILRRNLVVTRVVKGARSKNNSTCPGRSQTGLNLRRSMLEATGVDAGSRSTRELIPHRASDQHAA